MLEPRTAQRLARCDSKENGGVWGFDVVARENENGMLEGHGDGSLSALQYSVQSITSGEFEAESAIALHVG